MFGVGLVVRLVKDRCGVTVIEYAFIASIISIAAYAAMGTIGGSLTATFSKVASGL
jgi:pilus assembly protein Flp/PilA